MPPKIEVTRDRVLDAAFELVRAKGVERLSARAVAQAIGCSTQPIYRAFGSMTELTHAVFERAAALAALYLTREEAESSFLAAGYGILRFAQDEPRLYQLITSADQVVEPLLAGASPPDMALERMRAVPELAALGNDQLVRIHTLLWFFSLGIATLFQRERAQDPMPLAREYLNLAGRAVIAWELGQANQ